jgi:hypothetical protein
MVSTDEAVTDRKDLGSMGKIPKEDWYLRGKTRQVNRLNNFLSRNPQPTETHFI